ncbi:MAG: DUF2497 domain-containing protein [Pseudomonadota bacterium]
MSSTERAPEPTMEDILASIRRIITDDDAGNAPADKTATATPAEEQTVEAEADNQIIDDIARVLSSGSDAPANQDEEIMDLTGELGGLELVEEEPEEILESAEAVDTAPEFVEATEAADEPLALDDDQPVALEPDVLEADVLEPDALEPELEIVETVEVVETIEVAEAIEPLEMEIPAEEAAAPEMPPMAPEMAPPPIPEPVAAAAPEEPKLSASEEAATALERAIAALKAGQSPAAAAAAIPTTAPEPAFEAPATAAFAPELPVEADEATAGTAPFPADIPMAVPMDSPVPEPETHLDPDADSVQEMAEFAGELEPAPEELVLTEIEGEDALVLEAEDPTPETESVPFWPPQAAETVEAETETTLATEPVFAPAAVEIAAGAVAAAVAGGTNGVASHETSGSKSLEDSIKEMLRPMLQEWLNENMPRLIREELDSDALQRRQD